MSAFFGARADPQISRTVQQCVERVRNAARWADATSKAAAGLTAGIRVLAATLPDSN